MKYSPLDKGNTGVFSINSERKTFVNLRDIWADFLQQFSWNWFITLTFRNKVSKQTANRKWNTWLTEIEKEIDAIPGYFRVSEMQARGVLHFHSLMLDVKTLKRLTWMDEWSKIAGYARIFKYEPSRGARFYLCNRYIVKELSDWKIGGSILKT